MREEWAAGRWGKERVGEERVSTGEKEELEAQGGRWGGEEVGRGSVPGCNSIATLSLGIVQSPTMGSDGIQTLSDLSDLT